MGGGWGLGSGLGRARTSHFVTSKLVFPPLKLQGRPASGTGREEARWRARVQRAGRGRGKQGAARVRPQLGCGSGGASDAQDSGPQGPQKGLGHFSQNHRCNSICKEAAPALLTGSYIMLDFLC